MSPSKSSRRIEPQRVYQLRIELLFIEPVIWRTIFVPETLTLPKLDRVVQAAMGWTNSHLHAWRIDGRRYGVPDPEWNMPGELLDERKFTVGSVLGDHIDEFVYDYDFGDGWVRDNVLPPLADAPETHPTARAMRDAFWQWMAEHREGALIVADCGWPVEAGMLSACVADDPSRAFAGPYPLHEVATLLVAAGLDPMASYAERVLSPAALTSHRKHHPTDDARVSALCARLALCVLSRTPQESR